MSYALHIGFRYLRSKKNRSISVITMIAITAVTLGVTALLSVLAITSGFQKAFRDKVLGVNAHVLIMKYGVDFREYRDVMARVRRDREVVGVDPFLIQEMMLIHNDRTNGVLVKGIDPQGVREVLDLPSQLIDGNLNGLRANGAIPAVQPEDLNRSQNNDWRWLENLAEEGRNEIRNTGLPDAGSPNDAGTENTSRTISSDAAIPSDSSLLDPASVEALLANQIVQLPDDSWDERFAQDERERTQQDQEGTQRLPGMIVGVTLARELGLGVGARVRLVSALSGLGLSADARTPVSRDYRIIGIFEAGFQEYDSHLVYIDLYEAQHFYGQGDAVTGIEIRVNHLDQSAQTAARIERDLGGPFHTLDWAELNQNLFTALEVQKVVLALVFTSITIVAAFMVVATLIMIVLEKKREIAILKAMGARDRDVLTIFSIQGIVIGIVGTTLGLLLGGILISYLDQLHFRLDPKVYLIDHLPVVVSPVEFVLTAVVAITICSTATLIPSLWAARMLPVDGLRYE